MMFLFKDTKRPKYALIDSIKKANDTPNIFVALNLVTDKRLSSRKMVRCLKANNK
jgi:hypothetical protein